MTCEKDHIRLTIMADSHSREESPPRSGTQTPAACRPLLRHAQGIHTWPSLRMSDPLHPDNQREQDTLEAALDSPTSRNRVHSYDALAHLKDVQEEYEEEALTPRPTSHGANVESALRPRPPPLLRRISHEVREREQNLQKEVEALKNQLKHLEEEKREEQLRVGFVYNRLLEVQRHQMASQQQMLNKLVALDMQGTGRPETFSRRGSGRWGGLREESEC